MTSLIKKSITLSFVSLFLWGSFTAVAHASFPIQGVKSDNQIGQGNGDGNYSAVQTIGTNLQGSLKSIVLWQKRTGGSQPATVTFYECNSTYTSCTSLGQGTKTIANNISNGSAEEYVLTSNIVFRANYYYAFAVSHANGFGNTVRYYGSNSNVYDNGIATSTLVGAGIFGATVTLADLYFQLKGDAFTEQLGFVGSYAPTSFEATSSPVLFDLVYYLDGLSLPTEYIGVAYNYDTGSSITLGKYTLPDTTTGAFNRATSSIAFTEDGSYSVNWWLVDPDNEYGTVGVPTEVTFSINATSSFFQTPAIKGIQNNIASTSCNVNFLGTFNMADCVTYMTIPSSNIYSLYGNIPKTLAGKFPFSYIASIQTTWKGLNATASTTPTLSYNLHDIGIGSTTPLGNFLPNIEVFSEATITTYLSSDILAIFRALIATVLIALTFLNIYAHTMRLMRHT